MKIRSVTGQRLTPTISLKTLEKNFTGDRGKSNDLEKFQNQNELQLQIARVIFITL